MARKILITCGLPYANGEAHLGHIVEYLQGDIYSRALKLLDEDAIFLCASDTHGTPIELKAREVGQSPEEFSAYYSKRQQEDFAGFGIEFDYFYTTHSNENKKHAEAIFAALQKRGQILTRPVEQFYCETDKRFLPDRFIKGTCPNCNANDQYGDVCEVCGKTYNPTDLLNAFCSICKNSPVRRESKHYFFTLGAYTEKLDAWLNTEGRVQTEIRNFVQNWIEDGLRDWDISRDGPYFGFKIPGEEDKYFYVWLDAPIGYISTTEKYCKENGKDFDSYWHSDTAQIEHIIGKDIVYFHTLFWPAMLMGSGYTLPEKVIVHGMLKVNGEKMSKTRGTFINARTYLEVLNPQYLRYYFAAHMTPRIEDIDLNLDDFAKRVNGELVNNVVNLASRSLQFAKNRLEGKLGRVPENFRSILTEIEKEVPSILTCYRERDFAAAIRKILAISARGNLFLQENAPWEAIKTDPETARGIVTTAANIVKVVAALLKPVLPKFVKDIETILEVSPLRFTDARCDLEDCSIGTFTRLMERVDQKKVARLVSEKKEEALPKKAKKKSKAKTPEEISIDDFLQVDLRVGQILTAEVVENSEKLLKISVDIGQETPRTLVAGIAKQYAPADLPGRKVIVVVNLAKKKLQGVESQGMILAAGDPPCLLSVPEDAKVGAKVK